MRTYTISVFNKLKAEDNNCHDITVLKTSEKPEKVETGRFHFEFEYYYSNTEYYTVHENV